MNESNSIDVSKVEYSAIESEILDLVNNHRKSIDLAVLKPLNIVSSVADDHTEYMIKTGEVSHVNFTSRSQYLINNANAKLVGENLGYGYGSAQGVVNSWLNCEDHKEVIQNVNYTHFGISVESNLDGKKD